MRIIAFISLLLAFSFCGAAFAAEKETLPASVVAVIDIQKIMEEALASKEIQKKLDARRSQFQAEITKEENELRKAEKELAAMRDTLAVHEYSKREQQLKQRFSAVESYVRTRRKVLDQSYTIAMDAIRKAVISIIEEVSLQKGINIVIVKQNIIWTNRKLDITSDVLTLFNKKIPKINVNLPLEAEESE
ncbi:MAG: OmpH family outer membrane protein [Alphaproteobacteria bacterium]|nr:OmpH family outer membrane protein [Alphaproteobacteria bacterium]